VDTDLFRSLRLWIPAGARGVFGGQVIAQASLAAAKTVPEEQKMHSLHSYFILAGNPDLPILYQVERIRDGKSYATRTVQAKQRGRTIFTITCSFHRPEPMQPHHLGPDHLDVTKLTPPEQLKSEEDRIQQWITQVNHRIEKIKKDGGDSTRMEKLHYFLKMKLEETVVGPMEVKPLDESYGAEGSGISGEPHRMFWLRSRAPIRANDSTKKALLAYASDLHLMGTVSGALGLRFRTTKPKLSMMVSLDHSMWFHANDLEPHEWMLYVMESPWSANGRGLVNGKIYSREGQLLLSVAQEGMVRVELDKTPLNKL